MLGQALASVLDHLEDASWVGHTLRELGQRHAGYGVTDAHYDTVAGALLWTLEMGLGEAFTPEVKVAWTAVYGVLATNMKAGARVAS